MDKDLDDLKVSLRSVAVSSPVDLDAISLLRDYKMLFNAFVPIRKYGYSDPVKFLREMCGDCFLFQGSPRNPKLTLIVPPELEHLDHAVQKQKMRPNLMHKGRRQSVLKHQVTPAQNNAPLQADTHQDTPEPPSPPPITDISNSQFAPLESGDTSLAQPPASPAVCPPATPPRPASSAVCPPATPPRPASPAVCPPATPPRPASSAVCPPATPPRPASPAVCPPATPPRPASPAVCPPATPPRPASPAVCPPATPPRPASPAVCPPATPPRPASPAVCPPATPPRPASPAVCPPATPPRPASPAVCPPATPPRPASPAVCPPATPPRPASPAVCPPATPPRPASPAVCPPTPSQALLALLPLQQALETSLARTIERLLVSLRQLDLATAIIVTTTLETLALNAERAREQASDQSLLDALTPPGTPSRPASPTSAYSGVCPPAPSQPLLAPLPLPLQLALETLLARTIERLLASLRRLDLATAIIVTTTAETLLLDAMQASERGSDGARRPNSRARSDASAPPLAPPQVDFAASSPPPPALNISE